MSEIRIESLDDPRLDVYRSLKKTNQTRRDDVFVAEGVTVVDRLLQSDFEVDSVLITEQKIAAFRRKHSTNAKVYLLSRELATELVGYSFHLGVLAAARRRAGQSLPSVLPESGSSLVMVADHIIDQQNMGLLIRIASGFGADALLTTAGSADPFSRRSIRVSMGNVFSLPIIAWQQGGHNAIKELTELGYSCCAAVLSNEAQELRDFVFPHRTAIVFGNETHGISESVTTLCHHQLRISMLNGTDSLNVAIAAGIFGYAFRAEFPSPN